jgi:general stress protein YciG
MRERKPGPTPGSEGAKRISDAHKGGHDHDKTGGFAANPQKAREAGQKGGETLKARSHQGYFSELGRKGGQKVKESRGSEYYANIGRLGGQKRAETRRKTTES